MCLNIQYNTDSHTCQHVFIVFSTTASSYKALNTCAHAHVRVCLYECVCVCVCVLTWAVLLFWLDRDLRLEVMPMFSPFSSE